MMGNNIDNIEEKITEFKELNFGSFTSYSNYWIADANNSYKWFARNNCRYRLIPVQSGEVYKMIGATSGAAQVVWLSSYDPNRVEGDPSNYVVNPNGSVKIQVPIISSNPDGVILRVPDGAIYMYVLYYVNSASRAPSFFGKAQSRFNEISTIKEEIGDLEGLLYGDESDVKSLFSTVRDTYNISSSGEVVGGSSHTNNVWYIRADKGDKFKFTMTHTADKTIRLGVFDSVPVLGSVVIQGTLVTLVGTNVEYEYTVPIDGYFAFAYYANSGTLNVLRRKFNSSGYSDNTIYKGQTLNVIGDSISNPDRSEYSATTVWWGVLANLLGLNIGSYSCISGTPVGGAASNTFHNRVKSMTLDGTITIIAGGMNDLGSDNVRLGTFDYSSPLANQISADATLTNKFIPAYRELIEYILTTNKNTRLYLCTITPRAIKKTNMSDAELFFPWTNKSTHNNWVEFNDAIRKLAHDYGLGLIDFANIGMYQQNGFNDESGTLPADNIWTTDGVHPTVAYQKKMGNVAAHVIANTMF